MSNAIPENGIIPQPTQAPSTTQPATVAQPAPQPQEAPVFALSEESKMDTLQRQHQEIQGNIETNTENQGVAEANIEATEKARTETVADTENRTAEIQSLEAQNTQLNNEIRASIARIGEINTRTREIKAQIDKCSGFTGTLVNGLKNVIGMGVDVNKLKAELDALEKEKQELIDSNLEKQEQIRANNGQVEENLAAIELNDGYIQDLDAQEAETNASLAVIQGAIKGGQIALSDVETAIKDALENPVEPVEGSEANNSADALGETLGADVTQLASGAEVTTGENGTETPTAPTNLSDEQITGLATSFMDAATNGDTLTTDTVDALYTAAEAQDPTTGEFNTEAVRPIYESVGFEPEEIGVRLEVIEAITSYAEMGLQIDAAMFETASVAQLDGMIETAMVQDTIRATSTMVMGKGAAITTKKDMQKNAESVDAFIDTFSTLNSYYQANNVENLEVDAFLSLSNDKINKINQGYVYGTSELQELTSNAGTMMTTLKTAVSLEEAQGKSANIQFQENKHRADDAINQAEGSLNDGDDTTSIDEFRTEFLNLTSKFANSETDSAKQVTIKAMEALYQRALNADNGVDKDPYKRGINIAA